LFSEGLIECQKEVSHVRGTATAGGYSLHLGTLRNDGRTTNKAFRPIGYSSLSGSCPGGTRAVLHMPLPGSSKVSFEGLLLPSSDSLSRGLFISERPI